MGGTIPCCWYERSYPKVERVCPNSKSKNCPMKSVTKYEDCYYPPSKLPSNKCQYEN